MIVYDGILENVKEIRGSGVDDEYVTRYTYTIAKGITYNTDYRPNIWSRFWWFILFGVEFKKNKNPTIDRV